MLLLMSCSGRVTARSSACQVAAAYIGFISECFLSFNRCWFNTWFCARWYPNWGKYCTGYEDSFFHFFLFSACYLNKYVFFSNISIFFSQHFSHQNDVNGQFFSLAKLIFTLLFQLHNATAAATERQNNAGENVFINT